MTEQAKIERPIHFFAEGDDQKNFFEAFISHLEIQGVQIQNFGGVDELGGFLRALVRAPDFDTVSSIGVILDAEKSAADAFQSVQSSLRKASLAVSVHEKQRAGENPAVTVTILQRNNQRGILETLLCKSFEDSPINDCISEFCARRLLGTEVERLDEARADVCDATVFARFRRRSGPKRLLAVRSSRVCGCAGVPDEFVRFGERRYAIIGRVRQRKISGRGEIYGELRIQGSGFGRFDFPAFAVRGCEPPTAGRVLVERSPTGGIFRLLLRIRPPGPDTFADCVDHRLCRGATGRFAGCLETGCRKHGSSRQGADIRERCAGEASSPVDKLPRPERIPSPEGKKSRIARKIRGEFFSKYWFSESFRP